jgi:RNA 2',3'-cyclic 3'-phosphodiesterase
LAAHDPARVGIEPEAVIRAFIAIEIGSQTVENISQHLAGLKPRLPDISWISPANFHLTLKFLGAVEETSIDPITAALERELHPFPRFTINAKGLGVFPDVKRPRILWVGLEGEELIALASRVETALDPLGFAPEKREPKPHLTVGRWRHFEGSSRKLAADLESWKSHEFGASTVAEVVLFQSVLKPQGAVYHPLKTLVLKK